MSATASLQQAPPEQRILSLWQRFKGLPLGRSIFNALIGKIVPYTGTVKPQVRHLEPGFSIVEIKDKKRVRNHLDSIHAIALANLGEFASGLAMLAALPESVQSIVTKLEIDYLKKARGRLIAKGRADPPQQILADIESFAYATIFDADNDVVARIKVTWRLRPCLSSAKHEDNPDTQLKVQGGGS